MLFEPFPISIRDSILSVALIVLYEHASTIAFNAVISFPVPLTLEVDLLAFTVATFEADIADDMLATLFVSELICDDDAAGTGVSGVTVTGAYIGVVVPIFTFVTTISLPFTSVFSEPPFVLALVSAIFAIA